MQAQGITDIIMATRSPKEVHSEKASSSCRSRHNFNGLLIFNRRIDMKTTLRSPLLLAALMLVLSAASYAQVLKIKLSVTSHPPPYLSEWKDHPEVSILTVTNTGTTPIDVKFDCKVSLDGVRKANTKLESMRIVTIDPGTHQFYGEDIFPLQAIKFYGSGDKTAV